MERKYAPLIFPATVHSHEPEFSVYSADEVDAHLAALQSQHAEALAGKDNMLRHAVRYITEWYPQTLEEQMEQSALLSEIALLVPPVQTAPPLDLCGGDPYCFRPRGHEGEHDDICF